MLERINGAQNSTAYLQYTFRAGSNANVFSGNLKDSTPLSLAGNSEYTKLFRSGGIEAVNGRVNELLDFLRSPPPADLLEQTVDETNHILRSAIHLFPQSARGVEIKLKPGTEKNTRRFEGRYGKFAHYRSQYDHLLKAFRQENGTQPDSLILPLPYTSANRSTIGMKPGEDVYLKRIELSKDRQTQEPVLAVRLNRPYFSNDYTLFALHEVESIVFTGKGEFTPYIKDGVLIDKGTPETHYLRYRDFRRSKQCINSKEILIPQHQFSNLWQVDPSGAPVLIRGFIASVEGDHANTTLYELTKTGLPQGTIDEAASILFADITHNNGCTALPAMQFKGADIISRLFEIPNDIKRF